MNLADVYAENIDWRRLVELNCERVKSQMAAAGASALLACTHDNWRYLTSIPSIVSMAYATCNWCLLTMDEEFPYLFPLADVVGHMERIAPWFRNVRPVPFGGTREPQQPLGAGVWIDIVAQTLRELRLENCTLALDPAFPFSWHEALCRQLPRLRTASATDILRKARVIKNEEEQKAIRIACRIGMIGVEAGLAAVAAGKTETEIAGVVEYNFRAHGGEYPHSTPFVVSGPPSDLGLLGATHRVIRHGDLVRIDCGCSYSGYLSDYSRTISVGRPDEETRQAYNACLLALQAGARAAGPGVRNTDLHKAIDDALQKESRGRYQLGWFVGHGLGTGLHEDPMIGRSGVVEEFEMEPGMYFCLEPAIIVEGRGMVGLEDDYLLTEDGVETLTHTEFRLEVK